MLSREELRLINDILCKSNWNKNESPKEYKLQKKLSLLVEQIDIMEKAQSDAAKIQDEIVALDGEDNDKKEE